MQEHAVIAAELHAELADGLEERATMSPTVPPISTIRRRSPAPSMMLRLIVGDVE
jgi:hypothetical protein